MKKTKEIKQNDAHPIEFIKPRSLKFLSHKLIDLVEKKLWLKVLIGMFLGIITGILLGSASGLVEPESAKVLSEWLALPGIIFLRVIQMIVIPLIFASIIRGIAASDNMERLKKTGLSIALYFVFTTIIAIAIGVFLAMVIQPGNYISQDLIQASFEQESIVTESEDFQTPRLSDVPNMIGGIFPTNPFGAMSNTEMLQIVIFSIVFGIALVNMNPKRAHPLLDLLGSLQDVCMTIVKWAMILAPLAVFGLMARVTTQLGVEALLGTAVYVATVLLGLLILLLFYIGIVFVVGGISPRVFLSSIRDVQLLAFSTSSSAAVMPLSIKTAEEKLRVRPSISQFIIPIGATINMDGTALYQGIATVFLAQVFGVNLVFTALLFLIVTIVGASIGSPATPGVGIVILAVILGSFGIPVAGIALILGVDRILDMCRTAINVTGDLTACVLMNKIVGGDKTFEEEINEQTKLEIIRIKKGQDVIIHSK